MADVKKIYKISGMHCSSCAMDIDGTLEDAQGVKKSSTNYAKSVTEVVFEEGKISEDKIISAIKEAGYNAS